MAAREVGEGGVIRRRGPTVARPCCDWNAVQKDWRLCCPASKDLFHAVLLLGAALVRSFTFQAFLPDRF